MLESHVQMKVILICKMGSLLLQPNVTWTKDLLRYGQNIPNGCLDAYEVKVNIDILKYQEKLKPMSQFQILFSFFNGLLEFASLP